MLLLLVKLKLPPMPQQKPLLKPLLNLLLMPRPQPMR